MAIGAIAIAVRARWASA